MDDLGKIAFVWVLSAIGATLIADRHDKTVAGILLGVFLGPAGLLVVLWITGALNVQPNEDRD
jgi:hypothetical protein